MIKFLFTSEVDFYIRLRSNTLVEKDRHIRHAPDLLGQRKECLLDGVKIYGHWATVVVSLAIKRQAKTHDEYLIVMINTFAHRALNYYRRRWSIETFFQSVKQRGFRLEDTHLNDLERLCKLFALVAIAFTVCLHIGRWSNQHQKSIEVTTTVIKPTVSSDLVWYAGATHYERCLRNRTCSSKLLNRL